MAEITISTKDLVSVQDAAKVLKRHRYQIYRWLNSGKLTGIKFGGVIFIPISEINRLKAAEGAKG